MSSRKYRSRPVTIEAIQWDGQEETWSSIQRMNPSFLTRREGRDELAIDTLEGTMIASKGDFVIRGLEGELYPCKPDIFKKKYEVINE